MNRSNAELFLSRIWQWRKDGFCLNLARDLHEGKLKAENALKKLEEAGFVLSEDDLVVCIVDLLSKKKRGAFETVGFVANHDYGVDDAISEMEELCSKKAA